MKKLAVTVVALSVLSACMLTGCVDITTETIESSEPGVPVASDGNFVVGAIYAGDKRDTEGVTFMQNEALAAACEACGVASFRIVDEVPEDDDDQLRNSVEDLVDYGCDIIFCVDFDYMYSFAEAAEEYPEVVFCQYGGYISNNNNFINYSGRIYQAAYLSGIAAGFQTLNSGINELGFINVEVRSDSESRSIIDAFTLGARAVNPDAVVYLESLDEHADASTIEATRAHLVNDIHCGYVFDLSNPDSLLTYPVEDLEGFYELAIKTAMEESAASEFVTNMNGNFYGDMYDQYISISELNEACDPRVAEAFDLTVDLFLSGQFDVFSGTQLSFSGEAGSVSVDLIACDLESNSGEVIVEAGEPTLHDPVLRAYIDFYVEGVNDLS
jgi:basic membrane protein A